MSHFDISFDWETDGTCNVRVAGNIGSPRDTDELAKAIQEAYEKELEEESLRAEEERDFRDEVVACYDNSRF